MTRSLFTLGLALAATIGLNACVESAAPTSATATASPAPTAAATRTVTATATARAATPAPAATGTLAPPKQATQVATTAPVGTAAPAKAATAAPTATAGAYYANCDAARAAGVAPILRGQPGYRAALDRDGDGIACDK